MNRRGHVDLWLIISIIVVLLAIIGTIGISVLIDSYGRIVLVGG